MIECEWVIQYEWVWLAGFYAVCAFGMWWLFLTLSMDSRLDAQLKANEHGLDILGEGLAVCREELEVSREALALWRAEVARRDAFLQEHETLGHGRKLSRRRAAPRPSEAAP
jgi:hypothetical protein